MSLTATQTMALPETGDLALLVGNAIDVAQTLTEALESEAVRPVSFQSLRDFKKLTSLVQQFPHKRTRTVLQSIAACHRDPVVRKLANDANMVVGQSLKLLWNETRKDQVSDLESRAKRLAAVSDTTPYPVLILLIFNNTKGVPIESISDPRIRHLRQFLKHSNESVRMAGCWAFLGQGKFSEALDRYVNATSVLADIAVNSEKLGLSRDAIEITERLQKNFVESHERIALANQKASAEFVRKRMNIYPDINIGSMAQPNENTLGGAPQGVVVLHNHG